MHHERILKSTIQLFIKAFIIGVLVNLSLQHVAGQSLQADESPGTTYRQEILKQAPGHSKLQFSDQPGD
ncbi:MAG: hypothetical protein JW953_14305 [Anaerolineae bacterium]|nr:hypothetical protein [Anaerolineae bacterium]